MVKAIGIGIALLLLAVPAGAGPGKPPGPPGGSEQSAPGGPPGQGWGPYAVKGTITGIASSGMTFTLQVQNALPAHGNPNAPGQRKKISTAPGTRVVVRVIAGQTLIGVGRNNTLPFSSLAVGDRVQVWGAAQTDGTVAAVRVQLLERAKGPLPAGTPPPSPLSSAPGTVRGVIVGMSGGTLTLVTEAGLLQTVTTTTATIVRERGQVVGLGALHPYDIVQTSGAAGGVLAASTIDVEFNSSTAAQATGSVGMTVPALEGIMVGTTIVGVHPDTFVIQSTTRLSFSALTPGRTVTVYGTPVGLGPLTFGIQARVIVVH
jgi:hypothetical protein